MQHVVSYAESVKKIEHLRLLAVFEVCHPQKDRWTALIWRASLPSNVRGSGSHRETAIVDQMLPYVVPCFVPFVPAFFFHILPDTIS